MPALYRESRQCAICSTTTVFTCVNDAHYIDQVDLDGRPYELSLVALPHWIQACGGCHYRSRDTRQAADTTRDIIRSTPYQSILQDSGYPYIAREYRAAAHIARIQNQFVDAAWYHIRAVWKCEDIGHPFTNLCRKDTLQDLAHCLVHDQAFTPHIAELYLIVADLYRRNGDMANAQQYNQRGEAHAPPSEIHAALQLQQTLIAGNTQKRYQRPAS